MLLRGPGADDLHRWGCSNTPARHGWCRAPARRGPGAWPGPNPRPARPEGTKFGGTKFGGTMIRFWLLKQTGGNVRLTLALAGHFPKHVLAGEGRCDPPGVSTLNVVELREKDQSIALDEYLRLVVYCFYPRSTFDLVMTGQRSIFWEIDVFQLYKTIATQLWQISSSNFYHRVCWTIGTIFYIYIYIIDRFCTVPIAA